VFRGANSINLDSKGRIAIPAKYRDSIVDVTQSHMVVTCDPYEKCLLVFPLTHWCEVEKKLIGLSTSNEANRIIKHIMLGNATEVDMDASGRLLIPAILRERIGLEKAVRLNGEVNKFKLWDEAEWNRISDEGFATLASGKFNAEDLPELAY
jgi:MraZ protein